jgi:hypothetical protein
MSIDGPVTKIGNNLDAYRAAIGLFHAHTRKSNRPINFSTYPYKDIFLTNLRCSFLFAALLCLQSYCSISSFRIDIYAYGRQRRN